MRKGKSDEALRGQTVYDTEKDVSREIEQWMAVVAHLE